MVFLLRNIMILTVTVVFLHVCVAHYEEDLLSTRYADCMNSIEATGFDRHAGNKNCMLARMMPIPFDSISEWINVNEYGQMYGKSLFNLFDKRICALDMRSWCILIVLVKPTEINECKSSTEKRIEYEIYLDAFEPSFIKTNSGLKEVTEESMTPRSYCISIECQYILRKADFDLGDLNANIQVMAKKFSNEKPSNRDLSCKKPTGSVVVNRLKSIGSFKKTKSQQSSKKGATSEVGNPNDFTDRFRPGGIVDRFGYYILGRNDVPPMDRALDWCNNVILHAHHFPEE